MGRPLNKSRMSNVDTNAEGTAGKIEVTAYYPTGGSLQQGDNSFIHAQRSSRKFVVHQQNDSSDQVLNLRAVAPANLAEGQFCVRVILDDSTVAYVEKFYNNTVHYRVNSTNGFTDGTSGWVKYSLGSETGGADSTPTSGQGVIDVL
jgi:hypothetical protein